MNSKIIIKRIVASVLTVALVLNVVPMGAFAAEWNNSEVKVERNKEVSFSEMIEKLVDDKTTDVTVTVKKDVNGTETSKTVTKTTDKNVAFFVGDISSVDSTGVSFATGGDYSLVKGVGTVEGVLTTEAENNYNSLVNSANSAKAETETAQTAVNEAGAALLTAQAAAIEPGIKKTAAENAYNKAVQAVTDAQTAYDTAVNALNDVDAAIALKQAEYEAEIAELNQKKADLETAKTKLNDWKNENGFGSQAEIEAAIAAKQAEYDSASGWNKITLGAELATLKAMPSVLKGLEDALKSQQDEVDAQQTEVNNKKSELDNLSDEEAKELLQKDIEDKETALDNTKSDLTAKTTAKDEAVAAYNEAQTAVNNAQTAKTNAENALAEKQTAETNAWNAVTAFVNALTADDITFNPADVTYAKGTVEYSFTVKVFDKVTVTVKDEQGSMGTLPTVTVSGADVIEGNVYKLFEGETATITVPNVSKYRFAVTGATGSENTYTVGPVTGDTEVVVTYTEIGASSITFDSPSGATIIVNDGTKNLVSGDNVKSGTELSVSVKADKGYTASDLKVKDKDNNDVPLVNGKFTTSTTEENAYTITASAEFTGSIVNLGEKGEFVESVTFEVDGTAYTPGDVIDEGGKTVTVKPVAKTGYAVKSLTVIVTEGTDTVDVNKVNNTFTFTAKSGCKYAVSFTNENIEDIRSSISFGSVDNAKVEIMVEGDNGFTTLSPNAVVKEINPGSLITIRITPDENYYITNALVDNNARARNVVSAVKSFENGVKTLEFRTTATVFDYKIYVETATPVVAPNNNDVVINKYDIITNDDEAVNNELFSGFDKAPGITSLDYEYVAITIDSELADKLNIPAANREIWFGIETEITNASIKEFFKKELKIDLDSDIIKGILKLAGTSVDELLDKLLADVHNFGEQETEKVRAVFNGSRQYQPTTSASRTVKVQDLRKEVDVDIVSEISVVFGSYTDNSVILEKLLDGKAGVTENGTELDDKYDAMLSINKDLVGADVGTYTVEVAMADTDYDYKDTEKATATVKVTKANATVTATENNVILYKNIGALTRDYLVQVTPDVVINDEVTHLAFAMGLDANTNDPAKPAVFAMVDLSQLGLPEIITNGIISTLGGSDGLTLEELLSKTDNIKALLSSLNIDTSLLEGYVDTETLKDSLKALYAVLVKYEQYGDVYIKFVNDKEAVVPDSHGIYLVGAVTTDSNYNTAADATVIVVTAEPVTVKFDDANDNNARQFKFDGTQKTMTAKAYDKDGRVLRGTMKYIYAGVQSDGTPYLSTEAPLHAGSYTVTALFNDAGYNKAGFAVGVLAIWPSDVAEVGVENKVVVYDENNEKPVAVKDMITVLPEGTDAKVAVITSGIDVATDFSEEGLEALEGIVNIDFPERADTVLKKVLPSAYTENGITFETLRNKIAEIQTGLADMGFDASAMDQVITAIDKLPNATKLTFHNTYNGTVNENALPRKIGAYLVTAVIFDPDYMPEVGAGVLLITPDVTKATLSWTYNDMNGIITQPVLDNISLSATATVDNAENKEATDMIKYIFVGLDKEGEVSTFTADQSNIAEISKGLRNGAYTQVAYIWNGLDATMTVAQPIVREFVHVPQQMHIDFEPDENVDNVRVFKYSGKAIKMPVVVKKADGSEIKDECLEIRYIGVDSTGKKYDSTTAPTNVGTYTVTVTYKEYDVVPSYSLKYAGINIGVMIIEPAKAKVEVSDKTYECGDSCECECVKDGKVVCTAKTDCDCHKDSVEDMITVKAGDSLITVTVDKDGNVNILVPEDWDVEAKGKDIGTIVKNILTAVEKAEDLAESNAVSETLGEIIDELKAIRTKVEGLDEESQKVIDAVIAELEAINASTVKAELKEIINKIKALGLSSDDAIAEAVKLLEKLASSEATSAEVDATVAEIIALLNSVDAEATDEIIKAALGTIVTLVKELDTNEIKSLASDVKAEILSKLDSIDTSVLSNKVIAEIDEIIKQVEELEIAAAKSETEIEPVAESLAKVLKSIKIKSISVNGKEAYICGEYTIYAIAFGANYIPDVDKGTLVIECKEVVVEPTPTPTPTPTPDPDPTPTPDPEDPKPTEKPDSDKSDKDSGSSDKATNDKVHNTGDLTKIPFYMFIAVVSIASAFAVIYLKKRKE